MNDTNQVHHQLAELCHVELATRAKLLDIILHFALRQLLPKREEACFELLALDIPGLIAVKLNKKVLNLL